MERGKGLALCLAPREARYLCEPPRCREPPRLLQGQGPEGQADPGGKGSPQCAPPTGCFPRLWLWLGAGRGGEGSCAQLSAPDVLACDRTRLLFLAPYLKLLRGQLLRVSDEGSAGCCFSPR